MSGKYKLTGRLFYTAGLLTENVERSLWFVLFHGT